jgi:glycosyltransferase involved in cell wall biosynthesis
MKKSQLRVSLVIPVYNEESHLARCLDAIAVQTVKPFEVIVVDNNSTDATAAIARRYPFVTVLHEPRQGVVYARDAGFNAAQGDIIGRTDGDGILASDWVANVQTLFADAGVQAASGIVQYREVVLGNVFDAVDLRIRNYLGARTKALDEVFLYGVNMAIRRDAWQYARHMVCHARHLHEDLDLAVHLAEANRRVVFTHQLRASISPRQAAAGPRQFTHYVWSIPYVYGKHGRKSARHMYAVALFVWSLYLPIHVMYRGYNPSTQRFSLRKALQSVPAPRVSPVSEAI